MASRRRRIQGAATTGTDKQARRKAEEARAPRMGMATTNAPYGFTVQDHLSCESVAATGAVSITTTTGALTLPRLTTTQRNALTAANGMIIYNTTDSKFQGYAGGAWVNLH